MSTPHARRLPAWIVCPALLLAGLSAQDTVVPLPPVHESPLLLRVPQAPSGAAKTAPPTLAPTAPFAQKTASSTSASKQFTVFGGDLDLRSAFCLLCEDTAAALGRVLKDDAQFVLPVFVVLKTPPDITVTGPAVTLTIGELTHGGFHLQINAQLRTGFRTTDFTHELVRVLLAERILRNHKKLSTSRGGDVLPAWVMTGVAQSLEYRSRSRPSALFSAVFRRGQVYSLDRILAADPAQLDALSRGIYETSSCALVLTLLDQPDGSLRFTKFLNALAVESLTDRELLQQHFPNLAASKNALEKWWTLQMASLSTPTAFETLGVAQTEQALDEALMLTLPGAKKDGADDQTEEKKSGGVFGWLKREPKDDTKPEAKRDTKPAADPAKPEVKEEDATPFFQAPLLPNPFSGGKRIIFPFNKKQSADSETKAKDEAKAKPAAASKPKPEPPAASLSRKPGESRSIGGRPDDLPKAPPPVETKDKKEEAKDEAAKPDKPSRINPLNWFRNDKDGAPDTAEKPTSPARPEASQNASEPKTASRNPQSGSLPIEDFALIAKHPDRTEILNRCLTRLNALKLRAHPLYKPLIADYTTLVQELTQGKVKGASTKLESLRTLRETIHTRAAAVESHLDWHEANHTGTLSHAFDDFLKLDDQLEKERLPRNDSLSKYLDALEKEYEH